MEKTDPIYAAGECNKAQQMLRPPKEVGREALVQDQSGRGSSTRSESDSSIRVSKKSMASLIYEGGQVLMEKDIFGKARQDFKSVVSICESCRSDKKVRVCLSFVIVFRSRELQKEAEPIGKPSKTRPSLVIRISGGSGESSLGIKSNELLRFRERPYVGASSSMTDRAKLRSSGEPQRVSSSRYQAFASWP